MVSDHISTPLPIIGTGPKKATDLFILVSGPSALMNTENAPIKKHQIQYVERTGTSRPEAT